jgi:hypothetical protein
MPATHTPTASQTVVPTPTIGSSLASTKKQPEQFSYLKNYAPPSWLSISGGPELEYNWLSKKYIGMVKHNSGLDRVAALLWYETQNLNLGFSSTATKNPSGIVDANITSGDLTLSFGNYKIFANPWTATTGVTLVEKPNPDATQYTEKTWAHDWDFNWGWSTNTFIYAETGVTVLEDASNDNFLVERREILKGETRTVKPTGITLTAAAAVGIGYVCVKAWPLIVAGERIIRPLPELLR